jgi:hypothetical protein
VLTTAKAAGTNGVIYLPNTEELEIINFGHPLDDPLLTKFLRSYAERTDRGTIELLSKSQNLSS